MTLSTFCEPIGFDGISIAVAALDPPHLPPPNDSTDGGADFDRDDDQLDEMPMTDESDWEVFIPDELESDPLPEPGDFWPNNDIPWN